MRITYRKRGCGGCGWMVAGIMMALALCRTVAADDAKPARLSPEWSFGAGAGIHFFEGDQETQHGLLGVFRAAHDFGDHWTLEGTFALLPYLKPNRIFSTRAGDYRPGLDSDTWAAGLAIDGRYHFTRKYRLDPYLAIGVGAMLYGDDRVDGDNRDLALRAGGGLLYHFSETLALQLDARGMRVLNIGQANLQTTLGLAWTPGGRPEAVFQVIGGVRDSDGDGLSDWEELNIYFTDPLNPDTDGDGLSDYDEVRRHGTDPLNPDTDGDGLSDYEEVSLYGTDPLKRDTDAGGVDDWHEIMVDGTDPLNPADDLQLHTLYLNFDYDQAIIRPEFRESLDVIGLTLSRDPDATARIEGHADRLQRSNPVYNQTLSERRAQAVKQYLADRAGIAPQRITAVGYGFQRPREPNDPVKGNPVNRRVEIYIRSGEHIDRHGMRPGLSPEPEGLPAVPAPANAPLPRERPADTK